MIGIDPGMSGGMVMLCDVNGDIEAVATFARMTEYDIADTLLDWQETWTEGPMRACIESVHSMPKQGVASSFKFGQSFGFLRGLLTGLKIPYTLVTPQKWQKEMQCLTHGDKNVSKAAAQRRWPNHKWTHAIADAALIAEYGRRTSQ